MSDIGLSVAIVGAASELGREVQAVLDSRGVVVSEWRLFDTTHEGESIDVDTLPGDLLPAEAVELEGVDLVFICAPAATAPEWAQRGANAGALVIDVSQGLTDTAALIVPEANGDAVAEAIGQGMFACPVPGATALAVVLKPIDDAVGLKRVVVTALEPVSYGGTAGVDELAQQSRELLTGQSVESSVFPQRIGFNLIPQVGDSSVGGRTRGEWAIEEQTRRVLGHADLPLAVTSVFVPTFYGQAYVVNIETERPFDAVAATELLRAAPGVLLSDGEGPPTLPDVVGSEATLVGRLRDDPTVPFGIACWLLIDGLRKGSAVNAVQIAERALRERG